MAFLGIHFLTFVPAEILSVRGPVFSESAVAQGDDVIILINDEVTSPNSISWFYYILTTYCLGGGGFPFSYTCLPASLLK